MPKTIQESHIVGERGVNAFADYCNRHSPYLIWRPENINDFGIDGEVELSVKTNEGKIEPSGEIIKVQIKSTATGSYIHNDTEEKFDFYARPDDIEYWNKHSLSVVLIIYIDSEAKLYAKKIENIDVLNSKSHQKISFEKKSNLLQVGDNGFAQKFSAVFKSRINFDSQENVATNIFKFSKLPTFIFQYESKVKNVEKEIYKKFKHNEHPIFIIKENKVFTFTKPSIFPDFLKATAKTKDTKIENIPIKQFLRESKTKLYIIELINKTFKDFCGSKGVYYNKDYNRYYFALREGETERKIPYTTRKNRRLERKVVIYKKYIVTEFFRHFGFETNYIFNEEGLFMLIEPKLLFTSDRKKVLENKKTITRLTNYITSREHNSQCLNHIHFIFQFLSGAENSIIVSNYDNATITLSKYITIQVPYGIPLDTSSSEDELEEDNMQLEILIDGDED